MKGKRCNRQNIKEASVVKQRKLGEKVNYINQYIFLRN